jgi:hypothetical protein
VTVYMRPPRAQLNSINMLKKTFLLPLFCLLTANSSLTEGSEYPSSRLVSNWQRNQISISNDTGGYIIEYALRMALMNRTGSKVRFTGRCASACTMFLGLPAYKMCIAPGASFQFHMPRASSGRVAHQVKRFLYRNYPGWVRSWITSHGGLSRRLITMDYRYASKFIKGC